MDPLTYFTRETDARHNPDPGDRVISKYEHRLVTRVDRDKHLIFYYCAPAAVPILILQEKSCTIFEWREWAKGGRVDNEG